MGRPSNCFRKKIKIRNYQPSDCKELAELFFNTVHTVNARPFFEKRGYKVVKEQEVERGGIKLVNYVWWRWVALGGKKRTSILLCHKTVRWCNVTIHENKAGRY